jgi:hypothetical protein
MPCNIQHVTLDAEAKFKDSVVYKYQATFASAVSNPYTALSLAQSMGPNPVPQRKALLAGTFLYCLNIHGEPESKLGATWNFDVTFGPPPQGEDEEQQVENPLLRPPVFDVDYQDTEYVVKQARNVTALTGGFTRPSGTLGPIVNAAFRRPDEPIVRTKRIGIITITQNYADLGEILDLNEDYQETTNSDSVALGSKTFAARRLKYELTRSGGKQIEGDYPPYYPGTTEIGIYKTTDLIVDNVGYEYWVAADSAYVRAKDRDGEDTAEPVNLNLDGTLKASSVIGDTGPISLTYRDLTEVAYSGFFS